MGVVPGSRLSIKSHASFLSAYSTSSSYSKELQAKEIVMLDSVATVAMLADVSTVEGDRQIRRCGLGECCLSEGFRQSLDNWWHPSCQPIDIPTHSHTVP